MNQPDKALVASNSMLDDQHPNYQFFDIQRQRLISVIDTGIQELVIAYTMQELLTDHLPLLRKHLKRSEINAVLNVFNFDTLDDARQPRNCLLRNRPTIAAFTFRSAFAKSKPVKKSDFWKSIAEKDFHENAKKQTVSQMQINRTYFKSIVVKLSSIPEIYELASSILSQRSLEDRKYFVYLKCLREFIVTKIYETVLEEVNYIKSLKWAYVINHVATHQIEEFEKVLQIKLNEKTEIEKLIKEKIKCEKINQQEMFEYLSFNLTAMILASEEEILERMADNKFIVDDKKKEFSEALAINHATVNENLDLEMYLRRKVTKLEVRVNKMIEEYDKFSYIQNEEYEEIHKKYLETEAEFQIAINRLHSQDELYNKVMKQRDYYIEMTQLKFFYSRCARLIQHWWRSTLIRRWKKKALHINEILKKPNLLAPRRWRLKRSLKKIEEIIARLNKTHYLIF